METFLASKPSHQSITSIFFQVSHFKDLRDKLIIKNKGVFQVSFFQIHRGHPLHFHAGSEVAARRDVLGDADVAAQLAERPHALLGAQRDVRVVGHRRQLLLQSQVGTVMIRNVTETVDAFPVLNT